MKQLKKSGYALIVRKSLSGEKGVSIVRRKPKRKPKTKRVGSLKTLNSSVVPAYLGVGTAGVRSGAIISRMLDANIVSGLCV
jgi:hypothetical protein